MCERYRHRPCTSVHVFVIHYKVINVESDSDVEATESAMLTQTISERRADAKCDITKVCCAYCR